MPDEPRAVLPVTRCISILQLPCMMCLLSYVQANKPQFAASDCYYGCCGGAPKRLQMREESSSSQRRKQLAPKREHRRPVRSNT